MHVLDYIIFILALISWVLTGILIGCNKKNKSVKTVKQYFYGDGTFSYIPIGISIYSSSFSVAFLISIPAEIYLYGGQYILSVTALLIALPIVCFVFIPVICGSIKFESPYEYFKLRFGSSVQFIAFTIQTIYSLLMMPIFLYGSVLGLSEITNIPFGICSTVAGIVCILYTLIGGFTSVIWTDVIQATIMYITYFLLLIMGILKAGGFLEMWRRSDEGGRLNFLNLNPNLTERMSFWTNFIGVGMIHTAYRSVAIASLQRYLACTSIRQAQISAAIGSSSVIVSKILLSLIGLTMYAVYYNCDPIKTGEATNTSSIFPMFAIEIFENIPGFIGIFVTGLLSAGLSSLSSELNGAAGIIYYDVLRKVCKTSWITKHNKIVRMTIVFILGCYFLCVTPYMKNVKDLLQIIYTLDGVLYGTQFGLLFLGVVLPWANTKGAICGVIAGLVLTLWLSFGALYYNVHADKMLPTSTDGCLNYTNIINISNITTYAIAQEEPFILYRLSFSYYTTLNLIIMIVVGMSVSYLTGFNDVRKMDNRLIFTGWRKYIQTQTENIPLH